MIDGEGHFFDQHGTAVSEQEERDDNFNYEALDQGYSVMRLHYRDRNLFDKLIRERIAHCKGASQKKASLRWSPEFAM